VTPREAALDRLREICLALPESAERETWGVPTFRVRDKMFATVSFRDERVSVWCKAQDCVQSMLVGAEPERFFVPAYVGHNGWIGVRLDVGVNWDELSDLVEDSYRMTAPKRLSAQLDHPIRSS